MNAEAADLRQRAARALQTARLLIAADPDAAEAVAAAARIVEAVDRLPPRH